MRLDNDIWLGGNILNCEDKSYIINKEKYGF